MQAKPFSFPQLGRISMFMDDCTALQRGSSGLSCCSLGHPADGLGQMKSATRWWDWFWQGFRSASDETLSPIFKCMRSLFCFNGVAMVHFCHPTSKESKTREQSFSEELLILIFLIHRDPSPRNCIEIQNPHPHCLIIPAPLLYFFLLLFSFPSIVTTVHVLSFFYTLIRFFFRAFARTFNRYKSVFCPHTRLFGVCDRSKSKARQ